MTPPGWKDAYQQFVRCRLERAAVSRGVRRPGPARGRLHGGVRDLELGQPVVRSVPAAHQGAIDALHADGSEELKRTYLPKMISGQWTGTMNLTEPQAGSDLGVHHDASREAGRWHLPHHRHQDLHHLWRPRADARTSSTWCSPGCPMRRPARAAFRCSWCRSVWSTPMARWASATTSSAPASSTSSASTPARRR